MSQSTAARRIRIGDYEIVFAPGLSGALASGRPATHETVRFTLLFHLGDAHAFSRLRRAVIEDDAAAARLDDRELVELVARQVELGRWQVEQKIDDHPPIDPPKFIDISDLVDTPVDEPPKEENHWIEIELVDEDDVPIIGARYRIELPNGSVVQGRTGDGGTAHHDGIRRGGSCKVSFPDFDADAWEPA